MLRVLKLAPFGTVPARGLSQDFAVQTAPVAWLANSWDSPEVTATLLKQTPFAAFPKSAWNFSFLQKSNPNRSR